MEAVSTSEMSVNMYQTLQGNIPEDLLPWGPKILSSSCVLFELVTKLHNHTQLQVKL